VADAKIQLYYNLSMLLNSGVPILRAIPTAGRTVGGGWRRIVRKLEEDIRAGRTFSDSMSQYPRFFDPLEVELVRAGEEAGQLSDILGELSRWREFLLRLSRTFWGGMILPLFILHAAAVALNLPLLFSAVFLGKGNISTFFYSVGVFLLFLYIPMLAIVGIIYLSPRRGPLRKMLDTVALIIPIFGRAVRDLSISRYAKTFSILYGAGVPIIKAAEQATNACGNWLMHQQFKGAYLNAQKGEDMSKGFGRGLDAEFREVWMVGEESGDLDKCSERLSTLYAERAEFKFKALARGLPIVIYLIIMGVLAYLVIKGFLGIYGGMIKSIE
jgi:type II secretory pathway component PulF